MSGNVIENIEYFDKSLLTIIIHLSLCILHWIKDYVISKKAQSGNRMMQDK